MTEQILQLIEKSQTFLIASHESPDGDALGSTLALANALREMGKEVVAYNQDRAPLDYAFLPGYATTGDGTGQCTELRRRIRPRCR